MYARVVKWEGGDGDAIRASAAEMASRASSGGPPEGVPATGFLLLADPDQGRTFAIAFFETEDDMRTGDAALNAMSPPGEGLGARALVEMYEVMIDVKV